MKYGFIETLPEDHEWTDVSELFEINYRTWQRATKKQRRKLSGLYGITCIGANFKCSTGLLRFIAMCIFQRKKGFVVFSEDQLNERWEYLAI